MIFSWFYFFIFLQFIYTSAALIPLVATLAGITTPGNTNGVGTNALFNFPRQGDISPDGTIYLLADYSNHLIRQIIITTSTVSTLAGRAGVAGSTNGAGTNALFNNPSAVAYSPYGSYALITDTYNNLIRKIIISTAVVTKIAGGGSSGTSSRNTNGAGTNALFNSPYGICISPDGLTAVVADFSNHMIRMIIISTSLVSTLAGQTTSGSTNGIGTFATFNYPVGVDYFPDGTAIIVADYHNNLIRKIIISTGAVTTLAGATTAGSTNGIGTNSRFNYPHDIRISPDGSFALIADYNNHMIRSIVLTTLFVDTIIGTTTSGSTNGVGTNARLNSPRGVAIAPNEEFFLISDTYNHRIRYADILDKPTKIPTSNPSVSPSTSPSKPEKPPPPAPPTPTLPSFACPPGYFRKIDGDSISCVVLEEPSPSDGGNEHSSPTSDLLTCDMGDGKTDTPTTMIYLIVCFVLCCLVLFVVNFLLILYFGCKMIKAEENQKLKSSIQELKQSLLEKDHLISELQADIVRKDRELEESKQA